METDLSEAWTGFTQFKHIEWITLPTGIHGAVAAGKDANIIEARSLVPRNNHSLHLSVPKAAVVGGSKVCARVTGKGFESSQHSGDGTAAPTLDKTVGSWVWWRIQSLSEWEGSALGLRWGSGLTWLWGRYRSPAGRVLHSKEALMETDQCTVRLS